MKIVVIKVNAFTESINGGNPAGVVLNSPELTEKQMAYITKQIEVSETAFVFPSKKADYKIRFFTSEIEVDLCGHATIATFFTQLLPLHFCLFGENGSFAKSTKRRYFNNLHYF